MAAADHGRSNETEEDGHRKGHVIPPASGHELTLIAHRPHATQSRAALRLGEHVLVGRDASCHLSLASPTLSRFHARFVHRDAHVTVEDLGSRNGIWLHGNRVERAQLALGASLQLGDVAISLTSATLEMSADTHPEGSGLYLDPRTREVRALLQRVAPTAVPVLLLGETGTGKELAARDLHLASGRKGPLRVLNCAAIPPQLIESTLFGHERGAFTGADRSRNGVFEDAQGGTLLLDEVGELSLATQAALLRVLDSRRVTRVGSSRELELDVRIVSATHRDLQAMTARGEFRLDLFHRLCVVVVEIPPLRERRSEISALARLFLNQQQGPREIEPDALSCLEGYAWPGNIRELRNVLARAGALAQGPRIGVHDLPDALRVKSVEAPWPRVSELAAGGNEAGAAALRSSAPTQALRDFLKSVEHTEVQRALEQSGGNHGRAAALLGIPPRTFRRRVRALRDAGP